MTIDDLQDFEVISGGQETPEQPKKLGFLERMRLSFGGKKSIAELKQREEEAGLRGKLDIGDIADITGSTLPVIGGAIGAVGGLGGVALGAGAGEAVKRGVGRILGVREGISLPKEALGVGTEIAATYAGGKVLGFVGKRLADRFPKLLGIITGTDPDIVRTALANPKVADLGIKQGDEALRLAAQKAGRGAIQLRDSFIKGHTTAMDEAVFKGMGVTKGFARGLKDDITNKFSNSLKSNGVKIIEGGLDFVKSPIKANPGEITKINSAYEAVQNWTNWSQRGVHNLKQLIGQLTKFPTETGGTSKSPFLGRFYGFLNEQVKRGLAKDRVALYEQLNKKFTDNIDMFDDTVDAFNRGDVFTRLAQTFSKNKDELRRILDFYEKQTGEAISPIVAGRALAEERQAAFGFLNPREWIDFFWAPKEQAKFTVRLGQAERVLGGIGKRIKGAALVGTQQAARRLFGGTFNQESQ